MGDNTALLITLSVLLIIFAAYFYFEKSSLGTKEIAIIGTLSAFAAICRVPFAAIPNVQPTTFIVAISGYVFGPYAGFLVGSTAAFVSNIFLGQGPWTPWQMFSWGLVGVISGYIGKKPGGISVLGFVKPLNMNTIMLAYLTGLTVDIMHACGNFVFSMIFFEKFQKVLLRSKRRLQITYISNHKHL